MKRLFTYTYLTAVVVAVLAVSVQAADFVVIVNKANANTVDKAMIQKIYTGQMKSWPGGGSINALDLPESSPVRETFSTSVLGKSVAKMRRLWAQMIFTGRATPPKVVGSDDEVKRIVTENQNAIGYIKASSLDDSVKAVLK